MACENTLSTLPPKFSISAPGKVILHGEHSVVYGHWAIAASLNLRTRVDYALSNDASADQQFVHFILPNVEVDVVLSLRYHNMLKLMLAGKNTWDFSCPQNADFENLVHCVQNFVTSEPMLQNLSIQQQLALKTGLFLMVAILNHPDSSKLAGIKPFSVQVSSELPVGAGAGSSASYCVCLSTLFVCLASFMIEPKANFYLDDKTKDLISKWAFIGERITHGNPSGLDNSICTFGALISFRRPNTILKIPLHSGVRVLLVDTKVSRNTRTLVDRVAKLRERHGVIVDSIMQAMDHISSEGEKYFKFLDEAKRMQSEIEAQHLFSKMEELWSMNHSLLQALGVSHPSLDQIIQLSKEHNLCGKLTGAGGGGFAIILLPIKASEHEAELILLKKDLTNAGYGIKEVELGGPGVQLHQC
ncbi:hypothetical protein ONE63_010395 [Megalurothrips usitatus]|uniref:Mevalonate kinase n=1 Tax=Megalurothrips usitatus TaxID=439358 RepID=A0AAV7XGT4_9NEOP|nr:hypothetical protein ONE63_010395 [Megalurothrips usitatus]